MADLRWASTGPGFSEAPVRLFCFAHAGGGALFFRSWRAVLAPEIGVLAVVLPGRESRASEPAANRIQDILAPLASALGPFADRPYALLGHSMGAIIAYELTRIFCTSSLGAPQRLFVSGRRAPQLPAATRPRHLLSGSDFQGLLRDLGGTPAELLGRPDFTELFLPTLKADFQLNETYIHQPGPALSCSVSALTGDADPEVSIGEMAKWAAVTCRDFRLRAFPGGHFYLKGAPSPVVSAIREDLGLLTER